MDNDNKVKIHGTYPFDSERYPWKTIKQLTLEEASELSKVPVTKKEPGEHATYLWLNKAYVVLNAPDPGITALQATMIENPDGGSGVEVRRPVGTQAVYLHDGQYSLIERCS